jgi:hypothetical protein
MSMRIRCIYSGGYNGSRRDVGGRWRCGESRLISDTAAKYLLGTFPGWFVLVAEKGGSFGNVAKAETKSMKQPPADRAMPSPAKRAPLPDLTSWLALSNKALTRRINAGKADDVLAYLSEALEGNEDRASAIKAIKARSAKILNG